MLDTKKLKKEADLWFSRWIRLKYAKNGVLHCFTCGKADAPNRMQNGHYIPRSALSLRFCADNCRPQCPGCNVFKAGNLSEFTLRLIDTKGREYVDTLKQNQWETKKITPQEYEEMTERWKSDIEGFVKSGHGDKWW